MEWIDRGIRVNSISPGYTLTSMNRRAEVADKVKIFERDAPMGRLAASEEMVGPAYSFQAGLLHSSLVSISSWMAVLCVGSRAEGPSGGHANGSGQVERHVLGP